MPIFKLGCLCFWVVRVLTILDFKPLFCIWFAHISLHLVCCLFTFLIMSFDGHLNVFLLLLVFLVSNLRIYCQVWSQEDLSPMLTSNSFIALALIYRSLIHFVFVYGVRQGSSLILFVWLSSCPSAISWNVSPLNSHGTFVRNQLSADVWIYF